MLQIATFRFTSFYENTYIAFDQTRECIIVDPGCYTLEEKNQVTDFIHFYGLHPVAVANTHCHIDHVFGNKHLTEMYNIPLFLHRKEVTYLEAMPAYGAKRDYIIESVNPKRYKFIDEGERINVGKHIFDVLHTPGHSVGSVSLYCYSSQLILSGDVIFKNRIGKVDLPGGNYDVLSDSIRKKIFTLDEQVTIYPGHGPVTSVAYEIRHNPFLPGIF